MEENLNDITVGKDNYNEPIKASERLLRELE